MRYHEFNLTETTEEDRAIISLAGAINDKLQEYVDENPKDNIDYDRDNDIEDPEETDSDLPITLGTIGQLFDTPIQILNSVHIMIASDYGIRLRLKDHDAESFKSPDSSVTYGLWYGGDHPKMIFNQDFVGTRKLKSVIAHELRHALDDFKSELATLTSKKYMTPKKRWYRRGRKKYIAQPAEINARFVEVLHDLVPFIKRTFLKYSSEDIKPTILKELFRLLEHHEITDLFPEKEQSPDYKRLIKRAMDFIAKEMHHVEQQLERQNRPKQATGNW